MLPQELENHYCKKIELHAYELGVEPEDWAAYWNVAKDRGEFSVGVALPGLKTPLRLRASLSIIGR